LTARRADRASIDGSKGFRPRCGLPAPPRHAWQISQALAQGDAGRGSTPGPAGRRWRSPVIEDLPVGQNLIFHPLAGTPCFLLNLGKPLRTAARLATADKRTYEWRGGTGANGAIVAYSAICAHRLTYPTRDISFISYRAEKTPGNRHAQSSCSKHVYPSEGGVVAGPANPLAAILLDYDAGAGRLYAVGTLGGEVFDEFAPVRAPPGSVQRQGEAAVEHVHRERARALLPPAGEVLRP
jgi:Rieske Fe-S protein